MILIAMLGMHMTCRELLCRQEDVVSFSSIIVRLLPLVTCLFVSAIGGSDTIIDNIMQQSVLVVIHYFITTA